MNNINGFTSPQITQHTVGTDFVERRCKSAFRNMNSELLNCLLPESVQVAGQCKLASEQNLLSHGLNGLMYSDGLSVMRTEFQSNVHAVRMHPRMGSAPVTMLVAQPNTSTLGQHHTVPQLIAVVAGDALELLAINALPKHFSEHCQHGTLKHGGNKIRAAVWHPSGQLLAVASQVGHFC